MSVCAYIHFCSGYDCKITSMFNNIVIQVPDLTWKKHFSRCQKLNQQNYAELHQKVYCHNCSPYTWINKKNPTQIATVIHFMKETIIFVLKNNRCT